MAIVPRLLNEKTVALSGVDIDWTKGPWFTKTITVNSSFTMSNIAESGDNIITFVLSNGTAGSLTLSWPGAVKWSGGSPIASIAASKTTVFTFMKINGLVYATAIENYT